FLWVGLVPEPEFSNRPRRLSNWFDHSQGAQPAPSCRHIGDRPTETKSLCSSSPAGAQCRFRFPFFGNSSLKRRRASSYNFHHSFQSFASSPFFLRELSVKL